MIPLLTDTVAIPFTVYTLVSVTPGSSRYVPSIIGLSTKRTSLGSSIRLSLSSYNFALIEVDSIPPPSLTTILSGTDEGIST